MDQMRDVKGDKLRHETVILWKVISNIKSSRANQSSLDMIAEPSLAN